MALRENGETLSWLWIGIDRYPPSSKTIVGFIGGLMSGMGSLMREGGVGGWGGVPILENAPVFWMNLARAAIPLLVPKRTGRDRCLDAFSSILLCWLYLGQSIRMWDLVSSVSLSHGHVVGSGDNGRKN